MSAALALQSSVVSALRETSDLTGVFDDAPARANYPYVVLHCSNEKDWSCSGRIGREIMLEMALWDDRVGRLMELEERLEGQSFSSSLGDWQIGTSVLHSKKRSGQPGGPWCCVLSYRVRMLQRGQGN